MTEYDNMDIIITPTSNTWFLLIYDSTSHINDLHVRPLRKLKTFTSNSLPHGNMQQKLYLTVLFFRIQALHLHFHLTTKYFSIWLDKYEGYPVQLSGWVNNLKKKKIVWKAQITIFIIVIELIKVYLLGIKLLNESQKQYRSIFSVSNQLL